MRLQAHIGVALAFACSLVTACANSNRQPLGDDLSIPTSMEWFRISTNNVLHGLEIMVGLYSRVSEILIAQEMAAGDKNFKSSFDSTDSHRPCQDETHHDENSHHHGRRVRNNEAAGFVSYGSVGGGDLAAGDSRIANC
jgi:hypothetical protein